MSAIAALAPEATRDPGTGAPVSLTARPER
jgi:hypothetical protein